MQSATRMRPSTSAPSDASRTLTITQDPTQEEGAEDVGSSGSGANIVATLRLRGEHRKPRQRVVWGEDVVDNEGCGKKKSKICCIYHKPRRFDESSSEEDSSDSDSDSSSCGKVNHDHSHSHSRRPRLPLPDGLSNRGVRPEGGGGGGAIHDSDNEPNAYEKQPGPKKGKMKAT